MVSKKRIATAAASFGAALTSVYVCQEMQADILDLTYSGNSTATNPFAPGTAYPLSISIDQVSAYAWIQWNDQNGGTGRTQPFFLTGSIAGPLSADTRLPGDVVDPVTFQGRFNTTSFGAWLGPLQLGLGTEFDGTGSAYVVCRPRSFSDNLFWFKINFTQSGPIVYSGGEYGSEGEKLRVGGRCENVPGDLDGDGKASLLDVAPFAASINGEFVCEADVNEDGVVDLLDVAPFVDLVN